VLVFDLTRLAEAALLIFLLLAPLLFSLVPIGDELARRSGSIRETQPHHLMISAALHGCVTVNLSSLHGPSLVKLGS
jgi:hypothetical protein